MNSNWPRWIYASASKVFKVVADAYPLHLFLEGTKRGTDVKTNYLEFRMDGPKVTEVSHGYFKLEINLSVLFSLAIGSDFHLPQRVIGKLVEAMDNICVYKYGDGDAYLGTLQCETTDVMNFGQARPDTEIIQGVVAGSFTIYLEEG